MNTCTSDRCRQGKTNCPTPQACELPISFAEDEPMPTAFVLIGWIAAGMLALVAVSFIAGYFS